MLRIINIIKGLDYLSVGCVNKLIVGPVAQLVRAADSDGLNLP